MQIIPYFFSFTDNKMGGEKMDLGDRIGLYMELYAIVCQSEFLRKFHHIDEMKSMKEVPFVEIKRKIKKIQTNLVTGEEELTGATR